MTQEQDINIGAITETLNDKADIDLQNAVTSVLPRTKLLYGGGTNWVSAGPFDLNEPFTNFDLIEFIYSNTGEGASVGSSSYVDSKYYSAKALEMIRDSGGRLALFGYTSRFISLNIVGNQQFTRARNGDSGEIGIIAIYGIKTSIRT